MQVIIQRIEKDIAVVELPSGKTINVPKELFDNIEENDIVNISIDKEKTEARKKEIINLINDVFKD